MKDDQSDQKRSWVDAVRRARGRRALERQLEYQQEKARNLLGHESELARNNFLHSQAVRTRLSNIREIRDSDKILEVGSGAHGLVFGFAQNFGVGVDPLAVEYKRLFPQLQHNALTVAALGEQLPFEDGSFDIVMSDNVIDHAERPLAIIDEIVRVLKPDGILYFTVNVHHPFYDLVSHLHGAWNALGLKFELSPFADHTVHLTEKRISDALARQPIKVIEQRSTVTEVRQKYRTDRKLNADVLLKKVFFKNALFELIGVRK